MGFCAQTYKRPPTLKETQNHHNTCSYVIVVILCLFMVIQCVFDVILYNLILFLCSFGCLYACFISLCSCFASLFIDTSHLFYMFSVCLLSYCVLFLLLCIIGTSLRALYFFCKCVCISFVVILSSLASLWVTLCYFGIVLCRLFLEYFADGEQGLLDTCPVGPFSNPSV